MLFLSRKVGESIVIGTTPPITIRIAKISGDAKPRVRVGIDAPREVAVHRAEVVEGGGVAKGGCQ